MLKRLTLSFAALLAALLAAELLIRVAGAAPEVSVIQKGRFRLSANPKIGFEPAPLAYSGRDLSFYDYQGASNREGYRDGEHALAKPPGVYRIVVLGDSIGAGLHVERTADVFPAVLERLLRSQGVAAEVLNFSVSGYNTQQEVETLRDRALAYRPDLVIVAYSLTDRERMDGDILKTLLAAGHAKGGVSPARVNPYLVKSALYRFLRFRVLAPRARSGAGGGLTPEEQKGLDLVSGDTVAEYFGVLAGLAREHRFQVLVAVFPRIVKSFDFYRFRGQHVFVGDLARRQGFHLVDLLEPFARCRAASSTPIGADNWHPSAYGHRCAAEAIDRAILAEVKPPLAGSGAAGVLH
jgi:lysophospholipase L1-like esterase